MEWLNSLLTTTDSIGHIVMLYAGVISIGLALGRIKFFGISLGVTFVLFAGILAGHFGLTGTTSTLTIILTDGVVSSIQYDAVVE